MGFVSTFDFIACAGAAEIVSAAAFSAGAFEHADPSDQTTTPVPMLKTRKYGGIMKAD